MKSILQKELNLPVMEISDENATLEGGDVLFTGLSCLILYGYVMFNDISCGCNYMCESISVFFLKLRLC